MIRFLKNSLFYRCGHCEDKMRECEMTVGMFAFPVFMNAEV